jgi:hypothetical protein
VCDQERLEKQLQALPVSSWHPVVAPLTLLSCGSMAPILSTTGVKLRLTARPSSRMPVGTYFFAHSTPPTAADEYTLLAGESCTFGQASVADSWVTQFTTSPDMTGNEAIRYSVILYRLEELEHLRRCHGRCFRHEAFLMFILITPTHLSFCHKSSTLAGPWSSLPLIHSPSFKTMEFRST